MLLRSFSRAYSCPVRHPLFLIATLVVLGACSEKEEGLEQVNNTDEKADSYDEDSGATAEDVAGGCAGACEAAFTCWPEDASIFYASQDECVEECEQYKESLEADGEACPVAWEALQLCIGALECDEFSDYWTSGDGTDYPCAQEDAVLADCRGA